ncbi:hypothetical protein QBC33DRAFT_377503 [Phialemonium atrogriseum]|uniref:Uncharacterized protein n=1 Tax=Phialemonium atrogriseum TaxID=1093897 RepID=A0AAJ0FHC7_9PEZI|nr:uncharacterized protein QBC33DRAFT_377503 [Phialemonium atrogriseum]KAK1768446.1 hypothetical protein QBC33DRAFT_377503 [Phialemonium atrogriseum]
MSRKPSKKKKPPSLPLVPNGSSKHRSCKCRHQLMPWGPSPHSLASSSSELPSENAIHFWAFVLEERCSIACPARSRAIDHGPAWPTAGHAALAVIVVVPTPRAGIANPENGRPVLVVVVVMAVVPWRDDFLPVVVVLLGAGAAEAHLDSRGEVGKVRAHKTLRPRWSVRMPCPIQLGKPSVIWLLSCAPLVDMTETRNYARKRTMPCPFAAFSARTLPMRFRAKQEPVGRRQPAGCCSRGSEWNQIG